MGKSFYRRIGRPNKQQECETVACDHEYNAEALKEAERDLVKPINTTHLYMSQ